VNRRFALGRKQDYTGTIGINVDYGEREDKVAPPTMVF
jgi:hypothetical protein